MGGEVGCLVELGKTQFLENGINPEITGHVKSVWKYLFLTNLSVRNNILLLLLLSWFLMKICHAAMKIGFSQNLFRCCVFTGSYLHEPGENKEREKGLS